MRRRFDSIWYNQKFRFISVQLILLILLSWAILSAWQHLESNLEQRGIDIGFAFLKETSNFSIIFHLIPYNELNSYFHVFLVGLLNTLLVSIIGIVLATLLGFMVGLFSVSRYFLLTSIARTFVEIIRNIPLLLQLFFWYFVVLRAAPYPQNAIHFKNIVYLTNRGLYLPQPLTNIYTCLFAIAGLIALLLAFYFFYRERKNCLLAGKNKTYRCYLSWGFLAVTLFCLIIMGFTLKWQLPTLGRFNFAGGMNLIPEFIALLVALTFYTAAYIAEIVRMGILAVPKGQYEAAKALGFSRWQSLRLVIIPQAMRVITPPLTNQYLNLTKNSSLATAIAYPDLVSVFAGTALNQTGQALEIIGMTMAVYLFISLCISALMMWYESTHRWSY